MKVSPGQGLDVLPTSEVTVLSLGVRGAILRGVGLVGGQAALPGSAMWPWPRVHWANDRGQLGSWWWSLRRKAWGPASLASLTSSRGNKVSEHERASVCSDGPMKSLKINLWWAGFITDP